MQTQTEHPLAGLGFTLLNRPLVLPLCRHFFEDCRAGKLPIWTYAIDEEGRQWRSSGPSNKRELSTLGYTDLTYYADCFNRARALGIPQYHN